MPSEKPPFQDMLEAAAHAMVAVDRVGVIRFVNHPMELLFGYDRTELIGQPIELLVPVAVRQAHRELREGHATGVELRTMGSGLTLTGRQQDGTEFPVGISLSPVFDKDLSSVAVVRDLRASHD
ncbi:MAG: PAS domain S-box protein [Phycicoccus sp.]|nr:PAS domain S-box protein [Phycicoccus sp.]